MRKDIFTKIMSSDPGLRRGHEYDQFCRVERFELSEPMSILRRSLVINLKAYFLAERPS